MWKVFPSQSPAPSKTTVPPAALKVGEVKLPPMLTWPAEAVKVATLTAPSMSTSGVGVPSAMVKEPAPLMLPPTVVVWAPVWPEASRAPVSSALPPTARLKAPVVRLEPP